MVALTKELPAALGVGVVESGRRAAAPVVEAVDAERAVLEARAVGDAAKRDEDDARRTLRELEAASLTERAAIDDVRMML